jgi:hypothetical protein
VPKPDVTLDDAFDKLRWARHHFDLLRPKIEALENADAHTIRVQIDAEAGKYTFYIEGLQDPHSDLGLIVGDCVHNARAALDYLMVRIYALVSGQDPADVAAIQFPIYDDPKRFRGAIGPFAEYPMATGYLTRIEELQTYNNGNPSIWGTKGVFPMLHALPGMLDQLSRLDNIDKHRVTHAIWSQINPFGSMASRLSYPDGFEVIEEPNPSYGALKDGAEIGYVTFKTPLPSEWHPDEMDMKRVFPLQVAVGKGLGLQPALVVLGACLWAVESVLTLFDPVFAELKPPLSVTTIPTPN